MMRKTEYCKLHHIQLEVWIIQKIILHTNILPALLPNLTSPNPETVAMTCSALGSLARSMSNLDFLESCRGIEMMIALLDHSDMDVLHVVTGALGNVAASEKHRHILQTEDGIEKLLDVFEFGIGKSIELVILVCRTLYNFGYDAIYYEVG